MKVVRLAGLVAIAILAVSLAAASAASAGLYLFSTSNPNSIGALFLALLLPFRLTAGNQLITCPDGRAVGKVASVHLIGPSDITLSGCKSTKNNDETLCALNSVGQAAGSGIILTNTLHGLLGTTLPSGLGGILFLPSESKTFVTLEANACTIESGVKGNVAGLLVESQLGHAVLESLISFAANDPTLIDTLNGRVKPELEDFGVAASFTGVAHLVWDSEIEIEL